MGTAGGLHWQRNLGFAPVTCCTEKSWKTRIGLYFMDLSNPGNLNNPKLPPQKNNPKYKKQLPSIFTNKWTPIKFSARPFWEREYLPANQRTGRRWGSRRGRALALWCGPWWGQTAPSPGPAWTGGPFPPGRILIDGQTDLQRSNKFRKHKHLKKINLK